MYFCSGRKSGNVSDDEGEYASSRYVPMLKGILEDLADGTLSMDDYPSVMPMPEQGPSAAAITSGKRGGTARSSARGSAASARKSGGASSRWSKSSSGEASRGGTGPTNFSGGRSMVFVVGGASFSELRVARQVSQATCREIVLGSTAFLSPKDFVSELELLGEEEA